MDGLVQQTTSEQHQLALDNGEVAHGDLAGLLEFAVRPFRRKPGRPKRNDRSVPRPLATELSQAALQHASRATPKTVDNWRRGKTVPSVRKLCDTLLALGIRGPQAASIVLSAARERFQAEAVRFEDGIAPLLVDPDGSQMHLSIETTIKLEATVRSEIVLFPRGNGDRTVVELSPEQILGQAQYLMRTRRAGCGWIALSTGEITAPSPLICDLLSMRYEELNGLSAIDPRLVQHMERILANFPEALLASALMFTTSLRGMGDSVSQELAGQAQRFYAWMRDYLGDAKRCEEFSRQLATLPDGPSGDVSRHVLEQCLDAAAHGKAWPTDWQSVWNTMRIHIRRHDLLPAGQVARFVKTARPVPSQESLVYEVHWEVEDDDETAHELVKNMSRRLQRRIADNTLASRENATGPTSDGIKHGAT